MGKKKRRGEETTLSGITKSDMLETIKASKGFNEEEAIARLKSYRAPDDIVVSIFCFLDVNKTPSDRKLIHESMKYMKDKFPDMMSDFIFTTGDVFSYSPLLERILGRLQISNTLEMINPSGAYYLINPTIKEVLKERTAILFKKEEQKELQEMARIFQERAIPKER